MAVRELLFFGLVFFRITKFRIRMTMVSDWHFHWHAVSSCFVI